MNIRELIETINSRSSYINNWWLANPSKDCLTEEDEGLMTSQLNQLEQETKELVEKLNMLDKIIG